MSDDLPKWDLLSPREKDAIIKPLWVDGKSANEIRYHFVGATRNMIIGRIQRGAMKRDGAKPLPPRPKAARPSRYEARADKPRPVRPLPPAPAAAPPAPVKPSGFDPITQSRPPLPGHMPISILDLPAREGSRCRFGVEGGYCGAPTVTMYCETHGRIVYHQGAK